MRGWRLAKGTDFPRIKFAELNRALLAQIDSLLASWLPGGEVKGGREYFVHSVWRSEKTPSLSVCVKGENLGQWRDHGGDHSGGDLISLYAAIKGMSNGEAAVQLARQHGLEDVADVQRARAGDSPRERPTPPPPPPTPKATKPREDEGWTTVAPIPAHAPAATFWHPHRKPDAITHNATYAIDGAMYGYVVRFKTSDGGKDTLPYTWCISARDGASCWKWKHWDEPRPLYFPSGLSPAGFEAKHGNKPTVVVVEGERKADILQTLLDAHAPGVYLVVGWPGGSKAWKKADWHWLHGCTVLLWPDCDGKREQLTNDEKKATPDKQAQIELQQTKPLLPAHKQVGMVAMVGIGTMLADAQACKVQILPIPEPGTVDDGWDCADAIEKDGWDFARIVALFGQAQPLQAAQADSPPQPGDKPTLTVIEGGKKNDAPGGTKGGGKAAKEPEPLEVDADGFSIISGKRIPSWLVPYYDRINKRWLPSRKMVILLLERDPQLADVLAYNELSNNVQARVPWPWPHAKAGNVTNAVDLLLGKYLTDTYGLPSIARAALQEAIQTVAHTRRFHPIREYLSGLTWDKKVRTGKWLMHVLGETPESLLALFTKGEVPPATAEARAKAMQEYFEVAGRCWLLGMVYRVMEPGCKFDYCPVLEGAGGLRKSTMVETLAGAGFYSDTPFEVGRGKEAQEQVQGLWVYEIAEMTHFSKAEVGAIKAFISSKMDRYREAYGATLSEFPRQCVLVGTTNENTYLRDRTGNRRFWPIPVRHLINIEWLVKWRDQLLAEAYAMYQERAPYIPTQDQEARLFAPMQESRLVETAVQSELLAVLTREPRDAGSQAVVNDLTDFVTVAQLTTALGVDAAKSSPALEAQIRGWLDHEGWERAKKQINGARAWGYLRPRNWPAADDDQVMQAQPAAPIDGDVLSDPF